MCLLALWSTWNAHWYNIVYRKVAVLPYTVLQLTRRDTDMATHQMDERHEVSDERDRHRHGPDDEGALLPDVHVEEPPHDAHKAADLVCDALAGGELRLARCVQRLPDERAHHHAGHHHGHHAHRVPQPYPRQHHLQQERQHHGGDGAAERHEPVDDADAAAEVLAEDDHGGRVDEGGAASQQHSEGEVEHLEGRDVWAGEHADRGD